MLENYQQEQTVIQTEPADASFAEVWGVFSDGLALVFEGSSEVSEKHYKCNRTCVFHTFDRVRVIKDSGTYVVEYPVGDPITELYADTAGTADTAKVARAVDNTASGRDDLVFYYETKGHLYLRHVGGGSSDFVEFVAKGF